MRRICKRCRSEFDLEYRRGRPREHCFTCQPQDTNGRRCEAQARACRSEGGGVMNDFAGQRLRHRVGCGHWLNLDRRRLSECPFRARFTPTCVASPTSKFLTDRRNHVPQHRRRYRPATTWSHLSSSSRCLCSSWTCWRQAKGGPPTSTGARFRLSRTTLAGWRSLALTPGVVR
jgi:hypothetical protein